MTAEQFLENWLLGTTCHNRRDNKIHRRIGHFVVLKHTGHSEWSGRGQPRDRCPTYYALYDIRAKVDLFGRPYLWKREGRWKWYYLDEVKKVIATRSIYDPSVSPD